MDEKPLAFHTSCSGAIMGEGGFRYLRQEGIWYTAWWGMSGSITNLADWSTNIEDPGFHLLITDADVDAKAELDPTQNFRRPAQWVNNCLKSWQSENRPWGAKLMPSILLSQCNKTGMCA